MTTTTLNKIKPQMSKAEEGVKQLYKFRKSEKVTENLCQSQKFDSVHLDVALSVGDLFTWTIEHASRHYVRFTGWNHLNAYVSSLHLQNNSSFGC